MGGPPNSTGDSRKPKRPKSAVYDLLGKINGWVEKFTGFDLLGTVLPLVLGVLRGDFNAPTSS